MKYPGWIEVAYFRYFSELVCNSRVKKRREYGLLLPFLLMRISYAIAERRRSCFLKTNHSTTSGVSIVTKETTVIPSPFTPVCHCELARLLSSARRPGARAGRFRVDWRNQTLTD